MRKPPVAFTLTVKDYDTLTVTLRHYINNLKELDDDLMARQLDLIAYHVREQAVMSGWPDGPAAFTLRHWTARQLLNGLQKAAWAEEDREHWTIAERIHDIHTALIRQMPIT